MNDKSESTGDLALNATEQRALAGIDMDGLLATLAELIALRSDQGQETDIQHAVADRLERMGMEVDRWTIDIGELSRHPSYGAEIARQQAVGVVGSWGRGQGRSLILNGHVDVVPPGELERWTVPPFSATVRDGQVYGRGAVDMKGGLCCALHAVAALIEAGIDLPGQVMIQPVIGEEDGGAGTLAAIVRGHQADGAIVLEPTELTVAPAQAGALSFRIEVPGRAAHGALRTEGVDPLERFGMLHGALRELEAERNDRLRHPLFADQDVPFAICVGKVQAGVWASTVAETLVMEGRYGIAVDEPVEQACRELEAAVARVAAQDEWLREHPPRVTWWGARFMPAAISPDHPLVTGLAGAFQAISQQPARIRGMPYGADMHLLVNQGRTPTVLFGPGDVRQAHVPDEYVPVADLEAVTRTLVLAILRFCR